MPADEKIYIRSLPKDKLDGGRLKIYLEKENCRTTRRFIKQIKGAMK
jgi:hypothetical protein